jgi:CHASE3 domain sensor protein
MKKIMATLAVVVTLAVTAGAAQAFQCPTLIKQGRDAAAKMDAKDDKVKKAVAQLDRAEALHKEGKHADSVKEANEALGMLGVKK